MESLDIISKKYILDKNIITGCHNYIPGYTELFENIRMSTKTLLEIGIGSIENGQMGGVIPMGYKTGNSLKCWQEYFINANIYGIDIYSHKELNNNRIYTFVADQSSSSDLNNCIKHINTDIDIIIDDGSHDHNHQVFSFMYLEKYLSKNGIYVIEDIQSNYIEQFKDLSIFPEDFRTYINLNYTVKYFDTRHVLNKADDFMMAFIRK